MKDSVTGDSHLHREFCDYLARFAAGRTDLIYGTATCRYTRNNVDYTFAGQWQAQKR